MQRKREEGSRMDNFERMAHQVFKKRSGMTLAKEIDLMNSEFIMTGRSKEEDERKRQRKASLRLISDKMKQSYFSLYKEIFDRKRKEGNVLFHLFDGIRQIYTKHDSKPSAAERRVFGRQSSFNRSKSQILALLSYDKQKDSFPPVKDNEGSLSPRGKAMKERLSKVLNQTQVMNKAHMKSSSMTCSPCLSSSQTNCTTRLMKSSQSMVSIRQTPQREAFELKRYELYDKLPIHSKKVKEQIKEMQQRLSLHGAIEEAY